MIHGSPLSIGGHPLSARGGRDPSNGNSYHQSPASHNQSHALTIRNNEILSENSNLKAKLSTMVDELNQARSIFEREQRKWQRQTENLKDLLRKKDKHIFGGTGGGGSSSNRGAGNHNTNSNNSHGKFASVLESMSPARPHFNHNKKRHSIRSPISPDHHHRLLYSQGSGSSSGGDVNHHHTSRKYPTRHHEFSRSNSPPFEDIRIVVEEEDDDGEPIQMKGPNPFTKIMSLGSSHPLGGGGGGSGSPHPDGGGGGGTSAGGAGSGGDAKQGATATARRNKLLEDIAVAAHNETTNQHIVSSPRSTGISNQSFPNNVKPPTPQLTSSSSHGVGSPSPMMYHNNGGTRAPSAEASVQAGAPGGGGGKYSKSPSGKTVSVVVQTNPSTEDDLVSDLRHLNAELLKVQAHNAMLSGSVDMLKRDVADAASEKIVKRYEDMTKTHIRQLSRALQNANGAIHERDIKISDLKRDLILKSTSSAMAPPAASPRTPTASGGVTTPTRARGFSTTSTIMSPSQRIIAAAQERIKNSAVGEGTVDSSSSPSHHRPRNADGTIVPLPPGFSEDMCKYVSDPGHSDVVAALQSALDVARAQLRCAMDELASKRAKDISGYGRLAPIIHTRTLDVGTQVSKESDIARTFTLYHQDFSQPNVERILTECEERNVKALMAVDGGVRGGGGGELISEEATQLSLRTARTELLSAHTHIEELEFALELERREKQRALDHVSGSEGTTVGEASRQAAHEIAFLCDTLNATRIENEQLQDRLLTAEKERQTAIQSLTHVKQRSEEVIRGCQDIADSSKNDTESAIISLLGQLHQKTSELSSVRNTLTATKRQNGVLVSTNDSLDRDLREHKMRVVSLRDSAAKIREEYNTSTVALRSAKAEIQGLKGMLAAAVAASSSPASGAGGSTGLGRARSGTRTAAAAGAAAAVPLSSPLQAAAAAVKDPVALSPSAGGGRREDVSPDHHNHSTDLERLAALGGDHEEEPTGASVQALHRHNEDSSPARKISNPNPAAVVAGAMVATSSSHTGTVTGTNVGAVGTTTTTTTTALVASNTDASTSLQVVDPSAGHLFQDLARYTPGAESPLQIVDGVRGHISHLSENVAELRREVKRKNERIQHLERQAASQHNASRRPIGAGGSFSSASRTGGASSSPVAGRIPGTGTVKESYQVQRLTRANAELLDERDRLEDELRSLHERCEAAERELVEGRSLMMSLINEQQQ